VLQIDIDFDFIHPGKNNILFEKWPTFFDKIIPLLMNSKIKNRDSIYLLQQLFQMSITNLSNSKYIFFIRD